VFVAIPTDHGLACSSAACASLRICDGTGGIRSKDVAFDRFFYAEMNSIELIDNEVLIQREAVFPQLVTEQNPRIQSHHLALAMWPILERLSVVTVE
jgi:hypothetical protein